jgi:hypothetical protein
MEHEFQETQNKLESLQIASGQENCDNKEVIDSMLPLIKKMNTIISQYVNDSNFDLDDISYSSSESEEEILDNNENDIIEAGCTSWRKLVTKKPYNLRDYLWY